MESAVTENSNNIDHWSIRADNSVLLDVPKESLRRSWLTPIPPTGLIHGTNFRHAVEFSRSRCTPSRPSRVTSGQPNKHYPVGLARSTISEDCDRHRPCVPLGRRLDSLASVAPVDPRCRAWGARAADRRTFITVVGSANSSQIPVVSGRFSVRDA